MEKNIKKITEFLRVVFEQSGHNPKPGVAHNLRVGSHLQELGYNQDIVMAGILHDLIEDTAITASEIKKEFGVRVTELVMANTFDDSIDDKVRRYRELFGRCLKVG